MLQGKFIKRLIVICTALFTVSTVISHAFAADKVVVVPLGSKVRTEQKSFRYFLQPSSFIKKTSSSSAVAYRLNGEFLSVSNADVFVAPISLPAGANIAQINCSVYDNSQDSDFSGSSYISFWRRHKSLTGTESFATLVKLETVGHTPLMRPLLMPKITYPAITSAYVYGANIQMLFTSSPNVYSQLRFYGCDLFYTLDVIVP